MHSFNFDSPCFCKRYLAHVEDSCEIFLDFLALVGFAQQVKRFIEAYRCRLKTFTFFSKLSLSLFTFVCISPYTASASHGMFRSCGGRERPVVNTWRRLSGRFKSHSPPMKSRFEVLNSVCPLFRSHQCVAPGIFVFRRWKVVLPEEEHWRNVVPVSHEHGNCEFPE